MKTLNKKIIFLIGFLLVTLIPFSNIANAACPPYPDEVIYPTISITGVSVTDGIVTLSVSFTAGTCIWYDEDGNITTICHGEITGLRLYIYTSDGNKFGEVNASTDPIYSGSDTLQWVSPSFAQDTYTLKVYAWDTGLKHDLSGIISAPATATVFVNNPLPSITSPADGSTVQGVVDVTCEFFSPIGIRELWFNVYDGMYPYGTRVSMFGHAYSEPYPTSGTYTGQWQAGSTPGAYNLIVRARDCSGGLGRYAWSEVVTVMLVRKMIKPVEGYLYSPWGSRSTGYHYGIDIVGLEPNEINGAEIIALANGRVVRVDYNNNAGHWLEIEHYQTFTRLDGSKVSNVSTVYCHLLEKPPVRYGDAVYQGQVIGRVGSSGDSTGPHLHFGVKESGKFVDPLGYLYYLPRPGKGLKIEAHSPVDIRLVDPDGYIVSKNLIEIEMTATYLEDDFDGDGKTDDRIWLTDRKAGDYWITILPDPNAQPNDTYSLGVTIDGQTMVLAQDVQIQHIPSVPYRVESKLCYSDFDSDGDVDFVDYAVFAYHWQDVNCPSLKKWCNGADLDFSSNVDFNDLFIFANNWLYDANDPNTW